MDPDNPVSYASESGAPANRYRRFELSLGTPNASESSMPAISIAGQYAGESYSYELYEPVTLDFPIEPFIELGEEDPSRLTLVITFNYLKWLLKEDAVEGWDHSDSEEIISRVMSSATIEVFKESPDGPVEVVESVTVGATKHPEATEGSGSLPFTIKLSKAISSVLEVDYRTINKTAIAGSDFMKAEGTLVFEAGSTAKTLEVGMIDDDLYEEDETFELELTDARIVEGSNTLGKATGGTPSASTSAAGKVKSFSKAAPGQKFGSFKAVQKAPAAKAMIDNNLKKATGTILNDDDKPPVKPVIKLTNTPKKGENSGPLRFTVGLSEATTEAVEVDYRTVDQTATAGSDYKAKSGTLVIPPGEVAATVDVTLFNDEEVEPDETLLLELTGIDGGEIDNKAKQAVGTILNDDQEVVAPPVASISNSPEADEADGSLTFSVELSKPSEETVSIAYRTNEKTARAGSDFEHRSGNLDFAPGITSKNITVPVTDDSEVEADETVELELLSAEGADIDENRRRALGTIRNDDSEPEPDPAIVTLAGDSEAGEGSGSISFTVELSRALTEAVEVDYRTIDHTANAGSDFIFTSGTLTFSAGETSKTVSVSLIDDEEVESNEQFLLELTGARGATLDTESRRGTGTILNDDEQEVVPPPLVSITNTPSVSESNGPLTFRIKLSKVFEEAVEVDYRTIGNTATAGDDFLAASGTITFAPGTVEKTIDVEVVDDADVEADESLELELLSAKGATIDENKRKATAVILDDDEEEQPKPPVSVGIANNPKNAENAGQLSFSITLSAESSEDIEVDYQTIAGSAEAGSDFEAVSSTLIIPAGSQESVIKIPVIDDEEYESDEEFSLTLTDVRGGVIDGDKATATGTILNDDKATQAPPPTVSITNSPQAMENAGSLSFTVRLSDTADEAVEVDYRTLGKTAQSGVDFQAASGTLVIPAGDLEGDVEVALIDDSDFEADETFTFELTGIRGGELDNGAASATGIILNDDPEPEPAKVSLVNNPEAPENSGSLSFNVQLSKAASEEVLVDYQTVNKTAKAGSDFVSASGTLSFPAGETQKALEVELIDDNLFEDDETFELQLVSANGASIDNAKKKATGTILNDDPEPQPIVVSLAGDAEAPENAGSLEFTVQLSKAATENITVDYITSDQSAIAGSDYTSSSGNLSIPQGSTKGVIPVSILDDEQHEGDETFTLRLTSVEGGELDNSAKQATGTILNDDEAPQAPPPAVSITNSPQAMENAGPLTFTLELSKPSEETVEVTYQTINKTAKRDEDFEHISGTLLFPAGTTGQQLEVALVDEDEVEADETFELELLSADGATINSAYRKATGTILNDDEEAAPPVTAGITGNRQAQESAGSLSFTVSLSKTADEAVEIDYRTLGKTAQSGIDFQAASGTLVIPAGNMEGGVEVALIDDSDYETDETFTFELTGIRSGQLDNSASSATGTILNDDPEPEPAKISLTNNPQAPENSGSLSFNVQLSKAVDEEVEVSYQTINKTAKAGSDYTAAEGTVRFAPGVTQESVDVNLIDDDEYETEETFELMLNSAVGADIDNARKKATATIMDDDPEPQPVTVALSGDTEALENAGSLSFRVQLSRAGTEAVEVDYRTVEGTAIAGSDYEHAGGTLTIPAGSSEGTVDITVIDDNEYESDEEFSFELLAVRGGEVEAGSASATGTILNDDPQPEPVTVGLVNNPQAAENETDLSFIVRLSRSADETVEVCYQTVNKTAKAGSDFIAADGTLTFSPGTSQQTVAVGLIDDSEYESQETFELQLLSATGATIDNAQKKATATITDNDPEPEPVTAGLIGNVEGAENSGPLAFKVQLSEASDETVEVDYRTTDQSAKAGSDYQSASGTLVIPAGDTEGSVDVTLIDDAEVESDEQFVLELTEVRGADLDTDSDRATGTILNDDEEPAAPEVTVGLADEPEALENSDTISFTVQLSEASTDTVKVDFETQDNSAQAGSDYVALSGTAVFAPGTTAVQVTVNLIDDEEWENDEKFFLNLITATGAEIQANAKKVFGTILNDDEKDTGKGGNGNGNGNKNGKGS